MGMYPPLLLKIYLIRHISTLFYLKILCKSGIIWLSWYSFILLVL
ncbi:OCLM isoform 1 [Pongo abelii]|uniref:OCLM isoform 1 n=1 Tax=Pongo abelii TaxID=9601 RepID=A0A2J8V8C3_PONAB|nr:OCLM isoform 1 [Pongo abelii]